MAEIIKVLLIDDDIDYSTSLMGVGRTKGLKIVHETNWETGFLRLKKDPGIQFLILDGKCLLNEDQEDPKNNFLSKVLPELKVYEAQFHRPIPLCVNTGFLERFSEDQEGNSEVFGKGQDNSPMFNYIREEVAKTDVYKYKLQYGPAFEVFSEDLILPVHLNNLYTILEALEGTRRIEKQLFEVIRELMEEIFKTLQAKFNHFQDFNVFFNADGRPNLSYCERYLCGLHVTDRNNGKNLKSEFHTPPHISRTITFVTTSSSILSHNYEDRYTKFIFISVANGLLEILSWIPGYLKKNYRTMI